METSTTPSRSSLVTAFGWVMLVAGLMGTVGLGLNMAFLAMYEGQNGGAFITPEDAPDLPPLFFQILDRIWLILGVTLISCLFMAAAGLGVVRRHEWGRLLSIILLGVSVVWSFVAAFVSLRADAASMDGAMMPQAVSIAMNFGLALLTTALHGWIIWKLTRPEVRAEFKKVP